MPRQCSCRIQSPLFPLLRELVNRHERTDSSTFRVGYKIDRPVCNSVTVSFLQRKPLVVFAFCR